MKKINSFILLIVFTSIALVSCINEVEQSPRELNFELISMTVSQKANDTSLKNFPQLIKIVNMITRKAYYVTSTCPVYELGVCSIPVEVTGPANYTISVSSVEGYDNTVSWRVLNSKIKYFRIKHP